MSGFFTLDETNIKNKINKSKTKTQTKIYDCEICGLYKTCITPKMEPTGKGKQSILIIAEAPGKTEDEKGVQLIGQSGNVLRKALKDLEYDLDEDFWKTNAIICRPPKNRDPSNDEIKSCRNKLLATIDKYNPDGIILLGRWAFKSLLGERMIGRLKNISFSDFTGCIIPDQKMGKWIGVLNHPAYLLYARDKNDNSVELIWKKQLRCIIENCSKQFYKHNYESDFLIIKEKKEAIELLNKMIKQKNPIAFDYETTGKKPYRERHRIVTVSVSDGMLGYSFPFFEDDEFIEKWREFIIDEDIAKICHNVQFEQIWTKKIIGEWVENVEWCTMIGSHCLDNKRPNNLKYLVYNNFGVLGYDANIDYFIENVKKGEDKKSANAFNRIDEAPIDELLEYNALDSLFTYKLYEIQKTKLNKNQKNGFKLFMDAHIHLSMIQKNGIKVNEEKMNEQDEMVKEKINIIKENIYNSEELKYWDREEEFNFNSGQQLAYILFDKMKLKGKKTDKGNYKTDVEMLSKINIPIVKNILSYKKWSKVRNTYIAQYKREITNSRIHPFLNMNNVDTYRSSANNPNIQNIYKRDSRMKYIIRSFIVPSPGNKLKEYDYKSLEVCISACYNKDPKLIEYIIDPSTDMHRDMALQIFFRTKDNYLKVERYDAKNAFVFPSFYGSYWKQTAPDLWERAINRPDTTLENLKKNGIRNYADFEEHIKEIDYDFWNNRFSVYNEWKKEEWKKYQKKGCMDSYTGFRYYGPMKKNQVLNYKVQGSAFHCLLWTLIKVQERMRNMKSKIITEIHDAIVIDMCPEEEKRIDYLMWKVGTQEIREYWDWIIVPLEIEAEESKIDGSWANMKSLGYLKY